VAAGQLQLPHQRATAGQPVRLASRPVFLAGREALLAELDARLTAGGNVPGPRTVALVGLGGAGKTSVALEYAHRHLAETGVTWQFPAEDPAVLAAGFGELAAQLGARDLVDVRDSVASVHAVLAAYPAEWLLVFDNAQDRASVEVFLPPGGRGRVLVTSQNPQWPGQALDVPVLAAEVAAEFLVDRTGDADEAAAGELSVELGGLPLALEQAAAYVQASGDSLARYLALFRQRRADLLARGEPTGYRKTVAMTWALAFEQLEQSDPGAAGLLRLLACCAPEAVPLRLLLQPRDGLAGQLGQDVAPVLVPLLDDWLAVADAVAALRRYSLVSPPADGLVSVHRLVQAVTLDQMPGQLAGQWRQAAAAVIEAALPQDFAQPGNWPVFGSLLPHAQATLGADTRGMWRIASYLGVSGNHTAARDLWRGVLEAHVRVFGPEHSDTLGARANLASSYGEGGDSAGARDQFAALLPVMEQVSGPEHPGTLAARANLAYWTGEVGDPAGARDQYAALVPIRERVSGPEHPETLIPRANLARWTGHAGDPAGARDQYAALLPVVERVFGPEHPETLTDRANFAAFTGEAGDAAGARDQFAALVPIRERVDGPEHPETLTARGNLATLTGRAGDAAGARDQYAALLPVMEQVFGPEHPDSLAARATLARWTWEAGDPASAIDQYAALVPIRERVLGPEHPDSLAARATLARWTWEAGDPASARDQYATLLPVIEKLSGAEHPDTLAARANLAAFTGEAGDAAGARDQYATVLPVMERVLGPEDPDTLAARANLAAFTGEAGDAAGARDQYAALLPVIERLSGPEDPDTLSTRRELALWTKKSSSRRLKPWRRTRRAD
jgi:hypothetical protein